LFKGLGATLGREVPANAIYFSVYEYTKGALVPQGGSKEDLGSGSLLLAGGMAGLMFWGTVRIIITSVVPFWIEKRFIQLTLWKHEYKRIPILNRNFEACWMPQGKLFVRKEYVDYTRDCCLA
jgi:hypothetical protein